MKDTKILIVGRHSSGKTEVIDALEEYGVKVGREFCTLKEPLPKMYIDPKYIRYDEAQVSQIFENNAYIYISGSDEKGLEGALSITRGISFYDFDSCEVIALRPEQLVCMNKATARGEYIVVWMDNNMSQRISRHTAENRTYDFEDVEDLESDYDGEFVDTIYSISNSKILYFSNEDPQRVALIIKVIVDHPEEYLEKFLNIYK